MKNDIQELYDSLHIKKNLAGITYNQTFRTERV